MSCSCASAGLEMCVINSNYVKHRNNINFKDKSVVMKTPEIFLQIKCGLVIISVIWFYINLQNIFCDVNKIAHSIYRHLLVSE